MSASHIGVVVSQDFARAIAQQKSLSSQEHQKSQKPLATDEKYISLLSAYESAKEESRHAKASLEHMKAALVESRQQKLVQSMSTPGQNARKVVATTTPGSVSSQNTSMLELVDRFEGLLDEVAMQEEKIRELESKQRTDASTRWTIVVGKKIFKEQLLSVWNECKSYISEVEGVNEQRLERIKSLETQLLSMEDALDSSSKRQELARKRYDEEIERLRRSFKDQISHLKSTTGVKNGCSDADFEYLLEDAIYETETRCREAFKLDLEDLERQINALENQLRAVTNEKTAMYQEFLNFQQVKTAAISLLESRLGIQAGFQKKASDAQTDPLDVIKQATKDDAVRAVLQEAKFERIERNRIEKELATLIEIHRSVMKGDPTSGAIGAPNNNAITTSLQDVRAKIQELGSRLELAEYSDSVDQKEVKAWREEADMLQGEIARLTLAMPTA